MRVRGSVLAEAELGLPGLTGVADEDAAVGHDLAPVALGRLAREARAGQAEDGLAQLVRERRARARLARAREPEGGVRERQVVLLRRDVERRRDGRDGGEAGEAVGGRSAKWDVSLSDRACWLREGART